MQGGAVSLWREDTRCEINETPFRYLVFDRRILLHAIRLERSSGAGTSHTTHLVFKDMYLRELDSKASFHYALVSKDFQVLSKISATQSGSHLHQSPFEGC
jgi:hypothetical protein